tara:strand:- start:2737 stop:4131 length:1395 start_codon:yes stop_codon:yes gene_type:complete
MKNPFSNLSSNENIVSNSKYIKKNDIFLSLRGGAKYLTTDHIKLVKHIFLDSNDNIHLPKVSKIRGLNSSYLKWLDEYFEIDHSSFNNLFITGTNGKTSALNFLSQILGKNVIKHASTGTLGTFINDQKIYNNELTTEEPVFIRNLMSKCFQLNIKNIIFEASSIGVDKNRLEGLKIDHAIFTNISRDHLDYHGSLRNYVDAKFRLVSNTKAKTVAINFDDEIISSQLRKISSNQTFKISSKNNKSDIYFKVLKFYEDGNVRFLAETPWGKFEAASKIESEFNLYNLFLSLPYFQFINNDCEGFFAEVEKISLPIGRLNKTARENIYIDYAHSPEALESVCKYLYKKKKNKLVIVFGAGGERDKGKRGQMGEVADKYCEKIYITSDNPRNEDPQKIADMIIGGVKGFEKICVELDRASAIKNAINELSEEDILLIAGKGHENKQIIGNRCLDFSDFEEVKKCTA